MNFCELNLVKHKVSKSYLYYIHATGKNLHLKNLCCIKLLLFFIILLVICDKAFWLMFCFYWLFMMMFVSSAYPTCFPLTQFTCNNGRCININWRCDNGELLTCFHLCCFLCLLHFFNRFPSFVFVDHFMCLLCNVMSSSLDHLPLPLCHMGCVLQKRIVGTALMSSIVRTRPVSA